MKKRSAGGKRGGVGRADLLACFAHYGEEAMARVASLCGFEVREQQPSMLDKQPVHTDRVGVLSSREEPPAPHLFEKKVSGARFWRVVKNEHKPTVAVTTEPQRYRTAKPLSEKDTRPAAKAKPPAKLPLALWSRLWPVLRAVLGNISDGREVDWQRAVTEYADKLTPLGRLPRVSRRRWAPACQLILDFDERVAPFWSDFHDLVRQVHNLRGRDGLEIRIFTHGPQRLCRPWRDQDRLVPYHLPEPGTPILVLSDLGVYDGSGGMHRAWLRFGVHLRRAGFRPTALTPTPPRCWHQDMAAVWRLVSWDRAVRFPRLDSPHAPGMQPRYHEPKNKGVAELLALLAPAVSVEPELLRAARLLLPRHRVDVGTEAEAWHHDHTNTCLLGFSLAPKAVAHYRHAFGNDVDQELRQRLAQLLASYHVHLPPVVRHEEHLCLQNLLGSYEKSYGYSADFMVQVCKTLEDAAQHHPLKHQAMREYVHRLEARQHSAMWSFSEELSVLWAMANKEDWQADKRKLPAVFDLSRVAWVLAAPQTPRTYKMWQQGPVCFLTAHAELAPAWQLYRAGSLVSEFQAGVPILQLSLAEGQQHESYGLSLNQSEVPVMLPVSSSGVLTLKTDLQEMVIESLVKPAWATSIGRDQYGLYAEFAVQGVRQRMRWIPPGRFLMGSPAEEPERYGDETQHEVILTQGYWLADTACTQELWQAVMGNNPSEFKKGGRLPVEQVSWDECQEFLKKINAMVPELDLRLPTEAQWEYACRAGTTTPFSLGATITPEQVNYNGKYPYAGGQEGEYREKTVAVQSLPANPWGLYEMHGNVWEWCEDWFGDYPPGRVTDPQGPSTGGFRVLRGGSWIFDGGSVRSAYRLRVAPSDRGVNFGLRLARGQ